MAGEATGAVIVGGGLMGTAAAFFLARRGMAVTLLERGAVGAAATTASFGNVRRQGRFLPQLPLAHRSRRLWGELGRLLGRDVEFRAVGHVRLALDPEAVGDMEAHAAAAREWGLELELLGPAAVRARFPFLAPDALGASVSPEDGHANPRLVAPAFAAAAAALGARVLERTEVLAIEPEGAGFRVATAAGEHRAEQVLVAAGAWGARLSERLGEPVPIRAMGPQMGVTEPLPHRIRPVVGVWTRDKAASVYFRQVERGNLVFGGGERVEVALDPGHARVDPAKTLGQLPHLLRLCPALGAAAVIRTWSGTEGYTADMLPVMGPSGRRRGLFYAFGFCGHGFQLGPGVGDAMAELMATGRCETPLGPFGIGRFAEVAA